MILYLILFVIGLASLYFGAEWVVHGAGRLARGFGVSALIVGLTVVAFGNSSPELVIGIIASVTRQSDVAVGNVIGSNILNTTLILGVTAIIYPLRVRIRVIAREIPVMIAVTLLVSILALDGILGTGDALILLVGFVAYMAYVLHEVRVQPRLAETEYEDFEVDVIPKLNARGPRRWRDLFLLLLGLATLFVGARLLVISSVFFARAFGISELVIGLTVIAMGTSLPELATSVVAALRREADIALGNAIGSNVFNLLAVLGTAAAVRPLNVDASLLGFEIPAMILVSFVLIPFAWSRFQLERWEGIVLILGYLLITTVIVLRALGAQPAF